MFATHPAVIALASTLPVIDARQGDGLLSNDLTSTHMRRLVSKKRSNTPKHPRRTIVASQPAAAAGQQEARSVPVNGIDWSFIIRAIDVRHLERLSGASRLPAVKVWEVEPGLYRGIDGYHRWRIARNRGQEDILAVIYRFANTTDGEKAFEAECIRSNLHHGLPLTKAQRDGAIRGFWRRWGRTPGRPHGETMDSVGKLFSLTKQRVHQIVAGVEDSDDSAREHGFSSFARLTAATRRMSTLLADAKFLERLVGERREDVLHELCELRQSISLVLGRHMSRDETVQAN